MPRDYTEQRQFTKMYSPCATCIPYMAKVTMKKLSNKLNRELQISSKKAKSRPNTYGISAITAPAAMGARVSPARARFSSSGDSIRVHHREYVSTVYAYNGGFNINATYSINPGLNQTFPWLSGIAVNFEMYKVHSMRATIVPTVPTSTVGANYMFFEFDPTDPLPNKAQFLSGVCSGSAPVWSDLYVDYVKSADQGIKKYIRIPGVSTTGQDVRVNDVGAILLATDGTGSGNSIGDLYIEYDIELFSPAINPSVAYAGSQHLAVTSGSGAFCPTGVYTYTGPQLAYPIGDANAGHLRLDFQLPGQYLIEVYNGLFTTTGASTATTSVVSGTGVVTGILNTVSAALTTVPAVATWLANIYEAGTTIDLMLSAVTALDTSSAIRIAKYAYGLS